MKNKTERQKAAAGRTRGCFVSVYEMMTLGDLSKRDETNPDTKVLVQVVSENAACKNQADAKAQVNDQGLIGTFLSLRRVGSPFQRVIQQVASFVTPKNEDGFNEEPAQQKEENDD